MQSEPTLLCRLIRNQSLSTILSLKLKIKDQNTFMLLFTHTVVGLEAAEGGTIACKYISWGMLLIGSLL